MLNVALMQSWLTGVSVTRVCCQYCRMFLCSVIGSICFPAQSGEGTPSVTGFFEVQIVGGKLLHSKQVCSIICTVRHLCVTVSPPLSFARFISPCIHLICFTSACPLITGHCLFAHFIISQFIFVFAYDFNGELMYILINLF